MSLTGYTAEAMIRYRHSDPDPAATFSAGVAALAGVVTLSLSPEQTAALSKTYGLWDCNLTSPAGVVQRLVEGDVTISPAVTK